MPVADTQVKQLKEVPVLKILITPRSFPQSGEMAYRLFKEHNLEIIENRTGKTLTEDEMAEQCRDIDGIIVGLDPMTEKVLKSAKNLKAISKYGAGLDNIDLKVAEQLGIKVDRAAGTNATSVAELAVGLFFTLARSIPVISANTKSGGWDRVRGVELNGKTAGILGLGNVGREVARMASGLGMNIMAYDPYLDPKDECINRYSITMAKDEDVIRNADFLSLHLPLTDETKYVISNRTLGIMKKTAYLVNTSRGELVNEEDLYEALSTGKIAGTAEDVFSREPAGDHKLLSLDNFVLTSHIGAYTVEANAKMAIRSAENLLRMLGFENY
jgi:D-3-phosphoglycerate dehydrogenase